MAPLIHWEKRTEPTAALQSSKVCVCMCTCVCTCVALSLETGSVEELLVPKLSDRSRTDHRGGGRSVWLSAKKEERGVRGGGERERVKQRGGGGGEGGKKREIHVWKSFLPDRPLVFPPFLSSSNLKTFSSLVLPLLFLPPLICLSVLHPYFSPSPSRRLFSQVLLSAFHSSFSILFQNNLFLPPSLLRRPFTPFLPPTPPGSPQSWFSVTHTQSRAHTLQKPHAPRYQMCFIRLTHSLSDTHTLRMTDCTALQTLTLCYQTAVTLPKTPTSDLSLPWQH